MRIAIVLFAGMLSLAGCNRMLGLEKDYVLTEPLEVTFHGSDQKVILPAGTKVRGTLVKHPVTNIEVHGETNQRLSGEQ